MRLPTEHQIAALASSRFGYRSYKLLYLSASPMPEVREDWLPAQVVRVMWSRADIETTVSAAVTDDSVPQELADTLLSAGGRDAFRKSFAEMWDHGLRDYVLRRP